MMKRRKVYRAGLIGCGRIGADVSTRGSSRIACHAAAYRSIPSVRLVAASDTNESTLQQAGARWDIERLYTNYQEMLARESLDLISICTPTSTHAQVLSDVLAQRRVAGILAEKPIASSLEEAAMLTRQAADAGITVSVNYIRRFCPAYCQSVQEVREGRWGRPQYLHALYTKGVFNNGTHLLDLASWLLGQPTEVIPIAREIAEDDPTISLRAVWPNGVTGWLQAADYSVCNIFEVDLICTEGRLRFVDQGHQLERYAVEDHTKRSGFRQLSLTPSVEPTELRHAIRYGVEDLIMSVEQGRPPACTLDDSRNALALALRAMSAHEREEVAQ